MVRSLLIVMINGRRFTDAGRENDDGSLYQNSCTRPPGSILAPRGILLLTTTVRTGGDAMNGSMKKHLLVTGFILLIVCF